MNKEVTQTSAGKPSYVAAEEETTETGSPANDLGRESIKHHHMRRDSRVEPLAPRVDGSQTKVGKSKNFPTRSLVLWAVVGVVATSIVGLAYQLTQGKIPAATGAASAISAPPVVTVATELAKIRPVDDVLTVTGSVSAWDPLSVGAEVGNLRITSVKAEEGDLVKKGQVLATLNSALLRAQLEQAKAQLHSAQSSLSKAQMPNRSEEISALKAALLQAQDTVAQDKALSREAQETLDNARLNADRYKQLAKDGAASIQEAESKELSFDQAQQQLLSTQNGVKAAHDAEEQAQQKLLQATNGGRREDIDMSQSMIEEIKAQIHQLQEQIAQTSIRAPDDGLVAQRNVHIGDITAAGKTLFSIIRMNRLELRAQVSDMDLHKFHVGQKVEVSTTEEDKQPVTGKVWLVSPQVDQTSRLGTVRVELPSNSGLKPGMFVRGEVNLGHRQAITVPSVAVVARNGEFFVFTLDGNRVVSNLVTLGVQNDSIAEIKSGLKADVPVVTSGARFLSDRDVVRVSK